MFNFSSIRRPATIALSLTASIAIVACNPTPTPTATVTSVAVSATPTTIDIGATTTVKAVVTGTNSPAQTVTYSSSDMTVATVSATGVVTGKKEGSTVIKATSTVNTNQFGSVTIKVNPATTTTPTVTAVTVALNPASVTVGGTSQATAAVTGTNNPAQSVTWTSSDTAVATVSTTGVVTAKLAGTTDIIATSTLNNTKSGKATLTVTAAGTRPTVKINFAPSGSTVATYDTNSGAAYTAVSMTGWVQEADMTKPLDMTANVRPTTPITLAGAEPAQLTQINMQCGTPTSGSPCSSGTTVSGAFEYKMADGKYNVTVSVGDSDTRNTNSSHTINVEGTNVIKDFVPTSAKIFEKATKQITVSGGVMTIDAKGGKNTKINYIELVPVN